MTDKELTAFDYSTVDLHELLPQKEPFVMVSRMDFFSFEKTVTELDIEQGNLFVEDGVLTSEGLIENVAQTCAARIGFINKYITLEPIRIGYVCAIRDMEVTGLPKVGETVRTEVDLVKDFGTILMVKAESSSKDRKLAECTMTIVLDDSLSIGN